jgi:hypothetical protein
VEENIEKRYLCNVEQLKNTPFEDQAKHHSQFKLDRSYKDNLEG